MLRPFFVQIEKFIVLSSKKRNNAAIANLPAISNYNKEANENRKLKSTQQLNQWLLLTEI
jgi:hypothetical protein